jgi:hypothetical protein
LVPRGERVDVARLVTRLAKMGFRWNVSDGN